MRCSLSYLVITGNHWDIPCSCLPGSFTSGDILCYMHGHFWSFFYSCITWGQRKLLKTACGLTAWIHSQTFLGSRPSCAFQHWDTLDSIHFSIFYSSPGSAYRAGHRNWPMPQSPPPMSIFHPSFSAVTFFSGTGVRKPHSYSSCHELFPVLSSAKLFKLKRHQRLFMYFLCIVENSPCSSPTKLVHIFLA